MIFLVFILFSLTLGGMALVFTGGDEKTQKRVAAVAKASTNARIRTGSPQDSSQKRKNVAALLKDVEKNRAAKRERPTMRRRLEQAGFPKANPRNFWIICGICSLVAPSGTLALISNRSWFIQSGALS